MLRLKSNRQIELAGTGVSESKLNIYNPNRVKVSRKKIIENGDYKIFHLTGDSAPLRRLIGVLKIERTKLKPNLTEGTRWYSMPEYEADVSKLFPIAYVGYANEEDKIKLLAKLGIKSTKKYIHYPLPYVNNGSKYRIDITAKINPKYPVYVISKGRYDLKSSTAQALEDMGCPFKVVVEPDEYDLYAKVIDPKRLIKAPQNFSKQKRGGIPVRNFVWQHAVSSGAKKHWILDDNLRKFKRWNKSFRFTVNSGVVFRLIEIYVDRFTNILQAGMNYDTFVPARSQLKPVVFNRRIYSCILLDHHKLDKILKQRWRGKYNEDTDLSLRILKAGEATALFNAFLCEKPGTLKTPGGNTDTIYEEGNVKKLLEKAQSIVDQHPDVASVVKRYKRGVHHEVNYVPFKNNELGYKNEKISTTTNNYNMKTVKIKHI